MDGSEEVTTSEELLADAASRDPSDPRRLSIRSFLEHWGQTRRTGNVVATIKSDLAEKGLTTRPPFTEGSVDDEIALVPVAVEPGAAYLTLSLTPRMYLNRFCDLRIGSLPPAKVVSVPPTTSLTYARTLMLQPAVLAASRDR